MNTKIKTLLCCFIFSIAVFANPPANINDVRSRAGAETKTETIKVYGNCNMCKEKIEGSLKKKDGIISKKWDTKTKMLSVTYDPGKITIKQIGEKIAAAGYDNEHAAAKDEVYGKLHHCCQYERPKK